MYVEAPPPTTGLFGLGNHDRLLKVMHAQSDSRSAETYLHWDKLRRLRPPTGLSCEEWWWRIKVLEREPSFRPLEGLRDASGTTFRYCLPDSLLRSLHHIDQQCSGEVAMDEVVTSDGQAKQRFLVNSLMEEAIRSSQLEGATTSRRVAKELLKSGRAPRDRSETMIVNNYRALQFMHNEMGSTLTPEAVLELHRILTEGTLDDSGAAGRLQRPDEERVAVYDRDGGRRVHVPPPAEELPRRLELLCEFANEGDGERFIHPVIRSILLHFCLAYDHPFEDGNGRTARILFFWSMRERGYWLAEYLSISKILREAPAQYGRAFLETETDEGDTTYFLIHQLNVIERAIDDLQRYLKRKMGEIREIERLLEGGEGFNRRQLEVLNDAVRHPAAAYSFGSHARGHRVTHETARADLSGLAERGLLVRRRQGREYSFEPASDLPQRLRESGT